MPYRLTLVILLVLVSLIQQNATISRAQGTTYTDPFTYCAAVGNADAPDERYAGPPMPDAIARGLRDIFAAGRDTPVEQFINGSHWRCMDGQVYACWIGANLPCWDKANTDQTPTAEMTAYCQANPDAAAIPGFVTGGSTIYEWQCRNGVAIPGRQVLQVDARGFIANIWYAISPPESAVWPQTLPAAGASVFGSTTLTPAMLGAGAVLLGLLLRQRFMRMIPTRRVTRK